jgi:hypothetical protein
MNQTPAQYRGKEATPCDPHASSSHTVHVHRRLTTTVLLWFTLGVVSAQLPHHYLFYFHGGIVTVSGDNAINPSAPEWGRYEYSNIVDSLRTRGFTVISEIRSPEKPDSYYINKLVSQTDSLLKRGIQPANIILVGASAGADIVVKASATLDNKDLKMIILGACWPDTYKEYTSLRLRGHLLSIIESTDPHGTCAAIADSHKELSSFKEVALNTGLSHGFLYRGLSDWIDPLVQWTQLNKTE